MFYIYICSFITAEKVGHVTLATSPFDLKMFLFVEFHLDIVPTKFGTSRLIVWQVNGNGKSYLHRPFYYEIGTSHIGLRSITWFIILLKSLKIAYLESAQRPHFAYSLYTTFMGWQLRAVYYWASPLFSGFSALRMRRITRFISRESLETTFGIADPTLHIHYTTFMELRWRLRVVYSRASPL